MKQKLNCKAEHEASFERKKKRSGLLPKKNPLDSGEKPRSAANDAAGFPARVKFEEPVAPVRYAQSIETNNAYDAEDLSWGSTNNDSQFEVNVEPILLPVEKEPEPEPVVRPVSGSVSEPSKGIDVVFAEKGIVSADEDGAVPAEILNRLGSSAANEREAGLLEVVAIGGEDAFRCITHAFDDEVVEVRHAAARALFDLQPDRAGDFHPRPAGRNPGAPSQDWTIACWLGIGQGRDWFFNRRKP